MKSELFSNTEVQTDAMFSLQNSKMLKIKLNGSVSARQGSMIAYQGQADFNYQSAGGIGKMLKQKLTGEGVATMTVSGQADVFFADQSRDVHLIYLEGDAVSINGRMVRVETSDSVSQSGSQGKKAATRGAIGAGAGAVLGGILGGGKGAAIGAGAGAAAGTATALGGEKVTVPAETRLTFTLSQSAPLN